MGKPTVIVIKTSGNWRDAADAIIENTRARYNQAGNSFPNSNGEFSPGDPHAADGCRMIDATHVQIPDGSVVHIERADR